MINGRWMFASRGHDTSAAMAGSCTLSDNGDGTATVVYRLAVDVAIPMIGLIKRKAAKAIIETALCGLTKRVKAQ